MNQNCTKLLSTKMNQNYPKLFYIFTPNTCHPSSCPTDTIVNVLTWNSFWTRCHSLALLLWEIIVQSCSRMISHNGKVQVNNIHKSCTDKDLWWMWWDITSFQYDLTSSHARNSMLLKYPDCDMCYSKWFHSSTFCICVSKVTVWILTCHLSIALKYNPVWF